MSLTKAYQKRHQKRLMLLFVLIGLILFLSWISLISGTNGICLSDSVKLLELNAHGSFGMIIKEIRLPRTLGALLVGMLLGLSGASMQGALRNPLASPFTLGISQAAGFGAAFAIIILDPMSFSNPLMAKFSIALFAFGASMVCTLMIVWIGKKVGMSPSSLILAGVGLGSLFHSGTMFLQYFTTETNAAATLFWTFGDLSKATWQNIGLLLAVLIPVLGYLWFSHWKFDALGFGDESAFNRGVNVKQFRPIVLILSALCTAVAVAFFGIIGFIGLVAPHLVRLVIGQSNSFVIPLSTLCGGVLLLIADLFARLSMSPITLPVGILTSFVGAPLLLYLLVSQRRLQ